MDKYKDNDKNLSMIDMEEVRMKIINVMWNPNLW